jgi:hypothetical protein
VLAVTPLDAIGLVLHGGGQFSLGGMVKKRSVFVCSIFQVGKHVQNNTCVKYNMYANSCGKAFVFKIMDKN